MRQWEGDIGGQREIKRYKGGERDAERMRRDDDVVVTIATQLSGKRSRR